MMQDFLSNKMLWAPLWAMLIAQWAKVLLILLVDKKLQMDRLKETGGMPSSHSASVAALATVAGMQEGLASQYFAISMVFGSIVIYDAMGVRRHAGIHAEYINKLMLDMAQLIKNNQPDKALKTLLGHTQSQVFVGTLLGVLVGYLFYSFF